MQNIIFVQKMDIFLRLIFAAAIVCAVVSEEIIFSTKSFKGIAYLRDSNIFVLGRNFDRSSQFLQDYQTLIATQLFCSAGEELLFMDYIRGTEHWVVGCQDQAQIRSMSGLHHSFTLPASTKPPRYTLSYPFLDIHSQGRIFSCRVHALTLDCGEILGLEVSASKFMGLYTGGYHMWVKILIFEQTVSRLYIYSSSNSRCLEINAETYSAVQINSTVYIWTSLGVYKYNHQEDNDLEFVVLWPYEPRNKISSLGYVDGNLLFVIKERKLMVYNLDSNSTTEYDNEQTWRVYSYDDGVIVFQSGRAMNLHANHHVNVSRVEPVIPWGKTQEYLWLSPSFYQSNQTSPDGQKQNTTDQGEQREKELSLNLSRICWPSCDECRHHICTMCSIGFTLNRGQCEPSPTFALIATLEAYPYSNILSRMILTQLMEEFWFYEYHKYQYSQPLGNVLRYVGNVNRNRYIPPYVKEALPGLHKTYLQGKAHWGFSNSSEFTVREFHEKEKEPINFTVNASKVFLWNYPLCLLIYALQRLAFCMLHGLAGKKGWKKKTSLWMLVMIFLEGNVQYISFLFFHQLKQQPSALVFHDKVNLVVAVLFMFVAFTYTIGSFAIFSYLLSKKKFKVLFPTTTNSQLLDMLVLIILGPGRNLFLGFVQAFNESFALQMSLMLCLNILALIFLRCLPQKYQKMGMRFAFLLSIIVFLTCGLLNHYSLIFSPESFDTLQLICMCGLLGLCFLDFIFRFVHFVLEGVFFLIQSCKQKPEKNIAKEKEKNSMKNNRDSKTLKQITKKHE